MLVCLSIEIVLYNMSTPLPIVVNFLRSYFGLLKNLISVASRSEFSLQRREMKPPFQHSSGFLHCSYHCFRKIRLRFMSLPRASSALTCTILADTIDFSIFLPECGLQPGCKSHFGALIPLLSLTPHWKIDISPHVDADLSNMWNVIPSLKGRRNFLLYQG